jgi:hypothetical protein
MYFKASSFGVPLQNYHLPQGSISPAPDPKSAKRKSNHQFLLALLGSALAKAAHKMLTKLTPGLGTAFLNH